MNIKQTIKGLNVKKLNLKTKQIDFGKLRTRSEENNIRLRTKSAQSSNSEYSGEAAITKESLEKSANQSNNIKIQTIEPK